MHGTCIKNISLTLLQQIAWRNIFECGKWQEPLETIKSELWNMVNIYKLYTH